MNRANITQSVAHPTLQTQQTQQSQRAHQSQPSYTGKQLWIIAGSKGAGKTRFHESFLAPLDLPMLNRDLILNTWPPGTKEKNNIDASPITSAIAKYHFRKGTSLAFECNLNTYEDTDLIAKAFGFEYEIILVLLTLNPPDLYDARQAQAANQSTPNQATPSQVTNQICNLPANIPPQGTEIDKTQLRQISKFCSQLHVLDNSLRDRPFNTLAIFQYGQMTWQSKALTSQQQRLISSIDNHITS